MGEVVSSQATETGSQPSTRENLETYLPDTDPGEDFSSHVPLHEDESLGMIFSDGDGQIFEGERHFCLNDPGCHGGGRFV